MARLAGIQRKLAITASSYLLELEGRLKADLEAVLLQEESLWRQKSRISWLKEGEQNTRFFHQSVLIRRRRNRILRLKDLSEV